MSQRRIKTKPAANSPLEWIRTDDKSMFECLYIWLLTRGMYDVLEQLRHATEFEAKASREQKAQYDPNWITNADFCDEVAMRIDELIDLLHSKWDRDSETDLPPTAQRKKAVVGGLYPLPNGGLYVPKK